jgi:DNA ligase-1
METTGQYFEVFLILQPIPPDVRTCKHLRVFLGDEYEELRIKRSIDAPLPPKKEKQIPKLLLAHKWDITSDPTGSWISEKLDGVRAFWNGK